jgi:copper chaperone CopZ
MTRSPSGCCSHRGRAVSSGLKAVVGVESVAVDLETKLATGRGSTLNDTALRAATEEAGY